jgi:hypothetical protein
MTDLGASASEAFEAAGGCIDIPLSFGHTFTELTSVHSVLSSLDFLSSFLSAVLALSVLSFASHRPEFFTSFLTKTFTSFKTQVERSLQTTVLIQ